MPTTPPSPLTSPTASTLFRPISSSSKQWRTLLTPAETSPSRSLTPSTTSSRSIPRTPSPQPVPSTPSMLRFTGTDISPEARHVTPVRNATSFVTRPPPQASSRSDAMRPRPSPATSSRKTVIPEMSSQQYARETTDLINDMHDLSFMLTDHVDVTQKAKSVRGPGLFRRVLRRLRPGRLARQRERATAEAAAFAAARAAASGRVEVVFEEEELFEDDCWSENEFRRELGSFAKRNGTDIEPKRRRRWRGLDRVEWRGGQSSGSSLGLSGSSVTQVSHGSGFN